ncbi:MAG: flavodoxin reductase [Bacteroidia bacterium]|nr:flavodoxin reductase [Winogradskyella sp.]MBT8376814.1 flavodoxin reductase [Bacteroidia bacterium]NNL82760.1 flavodoxin reductase [Winogradskyella sp.]
MKHLIQINKIENVTHNVLRIVTNKPRNYKFTPGQATELAINTPELKDKKRPFTFTSLPEEDELEFTIKVYEAHEGVTDQLDDLNVGDELILGDAWGAISYKGPGTFIAGGAGITPFIAILKSLRFQGKLAGSKLFFGNKTENDIIYRKNLEVWLGSDLHLALSKDNHKDFHHGYIDKALLKNHNINLSNYVYLCGPPAMMESVTAQLYEMGLPKDRLVMEDFQ